MAFDLTHTELHVLLDVLHEELGRLKAEINRTETTAFRDELRNREAILISVITRLEAEATETSAV